MSQKIYVGNLSFSINNATLKTQFEQYGTVESAKIVTDRDSGRSKGFGFVEMSNGQEATDAINGLNGTQLDGRALTVNEAKPQAPRENSRFMNNR